MARAMKDSGIEWIGEIPQGWETRKVKNAFYRKKSKAQQENPVVLSLARSGIKIRDISTNEGQMAESYFDYNLVEPDDLLLNPMDLYSGANCNVSNVSGVISHAYINLKNFNGYCPKYYDYYFKTQYWGMALFAHGTGVSFDNRWTLNNETLMNYFIPVPIFETQQRIADYLDEKCKEIDSIIEKTKSTIEEYKKYKQAVITEAVTKGLNPNVEMKDSGIEWNRHIPSHWEVVNGRRLFELRKDKAMSDDRQLTASQKYGIMYQDEFMQLEDQRVVTVQKDFDILKHVEPNDFVISMRSFQGGLEYSQLRGCISSAYVMLIPNEKVYCQYFRWLFKCVKYINALQSTSNLVRDGQAMRFSNFVQIPLFLIPIEEQKSIAEYLDTKCKKIDNLIEKKQHFITELESYKKSLIYECVTGKNEVEAMELITEATVKYPLFPALLITDKKRFAQSILASKIIDMSNNTQFGRVKLEKILYAIETHIGFDFDTNYKRQVAGPLDVSIYQCEKMISRRNNWFNISEEKNSVKYSATKDMDKYKSYYNKYFASCNDEIERIVNIFKPMSTDQAEIFATIYAVWNDFIISGKGFTDDDIVYDVLNNWHVSKQRFSKDIWHNAIKQMKVLDIVPKGYCKKTIKV